MAKIKMTKRRTKMFRLS